VDENRWNGRYFNSGKIVENGVYTWYCILRNFEGTEHAYVGSVTVIR
ncbi:MAG: hypothetical protein HY738_22800, partial [Bacteroidia bacterium]|nr:hypothetical protein [Bacteroidia bacterium]MBI4649348.1 hypothetical protein [Bacteroidia bacterium]